VWCSSSQRAMVSVVVVASEMVPLPSMFIHTDRARRPTAGGTVVDQWMRRILQSLGKPWSSGVLNKSFSSCLAGKVQCNS
jgi:hypothetical protein